MRCARNVQLILKGNTSVSRWDQEGFPTTSCIVSKLENRIHLNTKRGYGYFYSHGKVIRYLSYWTAESRPMVWLISCLSQKNSQHHLLVVCLDRREDENLSPSVNEKPIMDWTVYIFLCSIKTQTKPCLVSFVRRGNVFRGQNRTKRILTDSYSARLILRNMPWKRKEH